ncbi:MAG: DsbA family protein, partial [Candidatus Binataceae bacterium]
HLLPKKFRFLRADLSRWAARYGAPLVFPEKLASFDREASARLNRGFIFASHHGAGDRYLKAAFGEIWGRGREPSGAMLRAVSAAAGIAAAELIAGADSANIIEEYERENRLAQERGVFGAPTFIAGDQIFWGNDRIDFLEEYLRDSSNAIHL